MSFSFVKNEFADVTHELASKISQMPGSATERPLDEKRMDYLKGQIMAGNAVTFHWAIAVRPDGTERRVNGRTSSTVLASLNGDMPAGLKADISHYSVDEERDEILLFRQFDARASSRSKADVAGAFQCMEVNLRDVSRPAARMAVDGIAWHLSRRVGLPVPKGDDVYDLFHQAEHAPFIIWMGNILTMKTKEIQKAPIVGAIFATWEKDPEAAKDFWYHVSRGGEDFAEKSPSTTLDRWLQEVKVPKRRKAPITDTELYQGCLYAWNAQRSGKTTIERINCDVRKGFLEVE